MRESIKRSNLIIKIVRCQLTILLIWTYAFLCVLLSIFKRKRELPTVIFFSLDESQAIRLSELESFLREDRFLRIFNSAEILFQHANWKGIFLHSQKITWDVPTRLLTTNFNRTHLIRLVRKFTSNSKKMSRELIFDAKILKREIFDKAIFQILDETINQEITLICTNSFLFRLPSAFESRQKSRIKRIMMWYSTNNQPIPKMGTKKTVEWNPQYIEDFIDTHLVWNNHEKEFLQSLGITKPEIVGSILFQAKTISAKSKDRFIITLFDVTPVDPELSKIQSLYSEESCLKNLEEIFFCINKLNSSFPAYIETRIKPKRKYQKIHSKRYIERLTSFIAKYRVEVLKPESNLYELVSQSDVVIGVPFTSPVLLGQELGTKAAYYSGGFENWDIPETRSGTVVIKEREELYKLLHKDVIGKLKVKF